MPLTLTIRNASRLDNGSPLSLVLESRGAIIGRAATTDWCLPDPSLHISSRHCEVRFAGGRYELIDNSTNGTFLLGQGARLATPHTINQGDIFVIGPFEIAASLDDIAAAAASQINAHAAEPEWRGWASIGEGAPSASPAGASAWDAAPAASAISGAGPMSQSWAAPPVPPPASGWGELPVAPSTWNTGPAPVPATPASDWSSPSSAPQPPSGDDIWGSFAQSNTVDWARGGFGTPTPVAPAPSPLAPSPLASSALAPPAALHGPEGAASSAASAWHSATPEPPPVMESLPPAPPAAMPRSPAEAPAPARSAAGITDLLAAAGVDPATIKQGEAQALAAAGDLLRRLVAGMVVMLEARARAKSQMGAAGTSLEFDGNNPLKFARTPEQALAQLLNPVERGFMSSDRAVEDAFKDLQAHQMATLKAMQGALRATLERFSPTAIRGRAENRGLLGKILPATRDAALWNAYEKEFGGVKLGSDEAFMDVFAKEFRRAYEEIGAKR